MFFHIYRPTEKHWELRIFIFRLMCDGKVDVSGWRCLPASLSDPPPPTPLPHQRLHSHGNQAQLQGKPLRSCLSCAGCFYFRHTSWQRLSLSVCVCCLSASVTHLHPAASAGSLLSLSNQPLGKSRDCEFGNTAGCSYEREHILNKRHSVDFALVQEKDSK